MGGRRSKRSADSGAFDRENVPEDLLRRKKKENIKAGISLKSLKQETRSENRSNRDTVSLGSDREGDGGKMDVWSRDRGGTPGILGVCLAKGRRGVTVARGRGGGSRESCCQDHPSGSSACALLKTSATSHVIDLPADV